MIQLLAWAVWQPEFNSPINPISTFMTMVFMSVYIAAFVLYREGRL